MPSLRAPGATNLDKTKRSRQHYVQDLVHSLKEDIVNDRLDDSGPLRDGRRLGVRLITPEGKPGFIEGRQLVDIFINDQTTGINDQTTWILDRVVVMKEAVLDFARRHQLPPPSWWTDQLDLATKSTPASQATTADVDPGAKDVSQSGGKQLRILKYLKEHYPKGVPNPGLCPRKILKKELLIRNGKTFWFGTSVMPAREAFTARNTSSSRSSRAGPDRTSTTSSSAVRAGTVPMFLITPASIALILRGAVILNSIPR